MIFVCAAIVNISVNHDYLWLITVCEKLQGKTHKKAKMLLLFYLPFFVCFFFATIFVRENIWNYYNFVVFVRLYVFLFKYIFRRPLYPKNDHQKLTTILLTIYSIAKTFCFFGDNLIFWLSKCRKMYFCYIFLLWRNYCLYWLYCFVSPTCKLKGRPTPTGACSTRVHTSTNDGRCGCLRGGE